MDPLSYTPSRLRNAPGLCWSVGSALALCTLNFAGADTYEIAGCDVVPSLEKLIVPLPDACEQRPSASLKVKLTLRLPAIPLGSGRATTSWPTSTVPVIILRDGQQKTIILRCQEVLSQADPQIIVRLRGGKGQSNSVGRQLAARQQLLGRRGDSRPAPALTLVADWELGHDLKRFNTESRYLLRACPTRARFPASLQQARAVGTRAPSGRQVLVHEVFEAEPSASSNLLDRRELVQVGILGPQQGLALALSAPGSGPTHVVPPAPPELDVAIWLLDQQTTCEQASGELSELSVRLDSAASGIRLRGTCRDLSSDPRLNDLWKRSCSSLVAVDSPRCGPIQRKMRCTGDDCAPGSPPSCESLDFHDLREKLEAFDGDAINIYYVPSIGGLAAVTCQSPDSPNPVEESCWEPTAPYNVVLVAKDPGPFPGRVAHELGHVLGLGHLPEAIAEASGGCHNRHFDDSFADNLMSVGSEAHVTFAGHRIYLGQVFQAYVSHGSWLHGRLDSSFTRFADGLRARPCRMHSNGNADASDCVPQYLDLYAKVEMPAAGVLNAPSPSTDLDGQARTIQAWLYCVDCTDKLRKVVSLGDPAVPDLRQFILAPRKSGLEAGRATLWLRNEYERLAGAARGTGTQLAWPDSDTFVNYYSNKNLDLPRLRAAEAILKICTSHIAGENCHKAKEDKVRLMDALGYLLTEDGKMALRELINQY